MIPRFAQGPSLPTWNFDSKTVAKHNSLKSLASNDQLALNLNSKKKRPMLSADTSPGLDFASLNILDQYMDLDTQAEGGEADALTSI
jgi:hypothetical protein